MTLSLIIFLFMMHERYIVNTFAVVVLYHYYNSFESTWIRDNNNIMM